MNGNATRAHLAPDLLSADEVRALLNACSKRAPTGIRNRALITVLYRAGLRISEALALELKDLDQERGAINVRHGKGDRQRFVAMDDGAWAVLRHWLDRRGQLGLVGRSRVFCTLKGDPMSKDYVRGMLVRIRRRAGITKRVHAHGFRHLFAVELMRESFPAHHIQRLLGHASLQTTGVYLSRIAPEETLALVRRRTWDPAGAPGEGGS
jgi:integrase/recombinase XerD